jgi:ribosomal protein L37AE/L43A
MPLTGIPRERTDLVGTETLRPFSPQRQAPSDADVFARFFPRGRSRARCPFCDPQHERRESVAVDWDKGVWYCHRCLVGGGARTLLELAGDHHAEGRVLVRTPLQRAQAKAEAIRAKYGELWAWCDDYREMSRALDVLRARATATHDRITLIRVAVLEITLDALDADVRERLHVKW